MTIPEGPIGGYPPGGVPITQPPVNAVPARGELQIKEKRSWKSWQLISGMVVALIVGMAISYSSNGGDATASSTDSQETLPPPAGSTASTTTPSTSSTSGAAGNNVSTTTTTDLATSSSTTTSVASTPAVVLLGPTQSQGNWTSSAFNITEPNWNIGWAFQCTPPPSGGPAFQIFVAPAGGTATGTPAVNETGGSGQSVTSQSTTGQQILIVEAPANCEWVVKVTGS